MPALPQTARTMPPLMAVGLLSAAVLAYEVLLMRLFAIVHWHHFAFMMISIALLGYGASGTLLALLPTINFGRLRLLFLGGASGFSLSSVLCFAAAQRLPFNALEVFWDTRQWVLLAGIYGLLFLPFFSAATGIGVVLRYYNHLIPKTYAADLAGAGCGASVAAGLLFHLPPATALAIVSAGAAGAVVMAGWHWRVPGFRLVVLSAAGWLVFTGLGAARWGTIAINTYKPLAQTLRLPDTRRIYEGHHPMGWFSAVVSPAIPFRHAPGLSLKSRAPIPEQVGLFVDGMGMQAVDHYNGRPSTLAYLRQTTASVGLHLRPQPERVFIADAGGGQDVLRALAHGAVQIEAADPHPFFPFLLQTQLRDFSGWAFLDGRVRYHRTTVRAFLSKPLKGYDIIQLPMGDPGGGAAAFGENTLLTREGVALLWQHLDSDGLLVVPLWIRLPPRGCLKAFLLALAALESQGISRPADHLAVIRGWRTAVILIGKSALGDDDRDAVRGFCRRWGYDPVFLKDLRRAEVNRHNILSRPFFAEATKALAGEERAGFIERYKFDLRPPTDDRPFFGHFFRWQSLPEIAALRRVGGITLLDWGYPVLLATLVQAALFSLILIGLPLLGIRAGRDDRGGGRRRVRPMLLYFSAIGAGFIFLEMAFMQRLSLFLHHPLMAATLTLGGFLLGAGGGSIGAHRALHRGGKASQLLCWSLSLVVVIGVLEIIGMPWLIHRFIGMTLVLKLALALGFVLPLATAMGMAFPLGMAVIADNRPPMVPWAWGINGCATVIGAAAVPLLALHGGYTLVMGLAVLFYAVGLMVVSAIRGLK